MENIIKMKKCKIMENTVKMVTYNKKNKYVIKMEKCNKKNVKSTI